MDCENCGHGIAGFCSACEQKRLIESLRGELAEVKRQAESWKKRAAQHGCNVDGDDDDCG